MKEVQMPKIVVSVYGEIIFRSTYAEQTETIIRDFVDDLGDSGGVFELQYQFYRPPSTCDSTVVVEAHYGQSDDRDSIQDGAGQELKARLEKLLDCTVSVRLLPKNYATFIK